MRLLSINRVFHGQIPLLEMIYNILNALILRCTLTILFGRRNEMIRIILDFRQCFCNYMIDLVNFVAEMFMFEVIGRQSKHSQLNRYNQQELMVTIYINRIIIGSINQSCIINRYKRKQMEGLVHYLFNNFISQDTSSIIPKLCKLKPITLTSSLNLTSNDLQLLQYLIAKNFVNYSSAHLQIRLDSQSVLFYQRVYKIKNFVANNLHPLFSQLFTNFIDNQLFPASLSSKNLQILLNKQKTENKGKRRKQSQHQNDPNQAIDYGRLIYESSQKQQNKKDENIECMVNLLEVTQLLRLHKIEEQIGSRSKQYIKNLTYKQGEEHLQSLSFKEMYKFIKENRPKSQFIEQLITKIKEEHIEQYILQTFRRYDNEQNTAFSRNILLVFNLIKKFPLSSQKQLINQSLLPVLILRKCVNLLISDGLVNYYPQNIRSTLYRITSYPEIEQRYINHIAQSIFNLHMACSNRNLSKEQLIKYQCMINSLDDLLLIFGY